MRLGTVYAVFYKILYHDDSLTVSFTDLLTVQPLLWSFINAGYGISGIMGCQEIKNSRIKLLWIIRVHSMGGV